MNRKKKPKHKTTIKPQTVSEHRKADFAWRFYSDCLLEGEIVVFVASWKGNSDKPRSNPVTDTSMAGATWA